MQVLFLLVFIISICCCVCRRGFTLLIRFFLCLRLESRCWRNVFNSFLKLRKLVNEIIVSYILFFTGKTKKLLLISTIRGFQWLFFVLLLRRLKFDSFCLQVIVAFPDDGAWKRFHKLLDQYPTVCSDLNRVLIFTITTLWAWLYSQCWYHRWCAQRFVKAIRE